MIMGKLLAVSFRLTTQLVWTVAMRAIGGQAL
jgi:hypothetical protein